MEQHSAQQFSGPPSRPISGEEFERRAGIRRIWAIVCWVVFGLFTLSLLSQLGSRSLRIASDNPAETVGMIVGFLLIIVVPLFAAILLGASRRRLLQQAADAYEAEIRLLDEGEADAAGS